MTKLEREKTTVVFDQAMGFRLRCVRAKMGLRQAEFGKLLGVSQWVITRVESGKMAVAKISTARLKSVIGKHYHYFLTGKNREEYEGPKYVIIDEHGNVRQSYDPPKKEE